MTIRTHVVDAEGFTLPQIIWRLLKRQPKGYLEIVLDFNPGLASSLNDAHEVPVGTTIRFPLDLIPPAREPRKVIRLWD